ncbi:MAG: hypothetical protein HY703_08825 [Gemmatimonadetes bacterium]|nr:hypothetical protein [Gemmatimonadota bacterium]
MSRVRPGTGVLPIFLLCALALPGILVGQSPQRADSRRAALEAQLLERFVEHVAGRLELDEAGRQQLGAVLGASARRRGELAREAARLRRELGQALEDSATADAGFVRLLDELAAVRAGELEVWGEEQQGLARLLTPRQRGEFTVLRARFHERVLELRRRGAGKQGSRGRHP